MKKAKFNIFNKVLLDNAMYPNRSLKIGTIIGVIFDENDEEFYYFVKFNDEYEDVVEKFITFLEEK